MELFFVTCLRSVVYGVIEGMTEWLPYLQHRSHDFGRAGAQVQPERGIYGDVPRRHPGWARSWQSWCCILKNCGRSAATTAVIPAWQSTSAGLCCACG